MNTNNDHIIDELKEKLKELYQQIKILALIHGDVYVDFVNWRILDGNKKVIYELDKG